MAESINEPALRHDLHPGSDAGHTGTEPHQAEITILECFEDPAKGRRLHVTPRAAYVQNLSSHGGGFTRLSWEQGFAGALRFHGRHGGNQLRQREGIGERTGDFGRFFASGAPRATHDNGYFRMVGCQVSRNAISFLFGP